MPLLSAHGLALINNPGGYLTEFAQLFFEVRISKEPVTVAGYCFSACTLVLTLPSSQVCATPGTVFGFHSAYVVGLFNKQIYSKSATASMWHSLPERVRREIRKAGWDGLSEHPELIIIPAHKLVRTCE